MMRPLTLRHFNNGWIIDYENVSLSSSEPFLKLDPRTGEWHWKAGETISVMGCPFTDRWPPWVGRERP